jgi:Tfp pilus assembly protein PilN
VSDRVGIEIMGTHVRAIALGAWGNRPRAIAEAEWDAEHPSVAVGALAGRLGRVGRVALAIGLEHLHVKHVDLPPAPASMRRQMVAVEPDRFFPVQGERVVVGVEGSVAFAVDEAALDRWIAAFESWAPVESVEAAPVALARALAPLGDACYAHPLGDVDHAIVEIRDGRLAAARHAAGSADGHALALPRVRDVPPAALAAWGAALGLDGDLDAVMVGASQRRIIDRRRVRRLMGAAAACSIAVGFALWALDRSRDDVLARLTAEQRALESRAAPAAAMQAQLSALEQEEAVASAVSAARTDPLRVLAALGERLPRDVTVLNARAIGDEWRIDGTAANAAAILPALDGDPRFADARFLAATARYREGGKTYESFSLAFRAKPGA